MIYSVAVFHQMHCLGQLRRFSWMFLDAITKNNTDEQAAITEMFENQNHASHLHHCFDYLRQTIACGGDMSMEWPRTEKDGRRFAVDGWGIPHECKNWVSLILILDGFQSLLIECLGSYYGVHGQQSFQHVDELANCASGGSSGSRISTIWDEAKAKAVIVQIAISWKGRSSEISMNDPDFSLAIDVPTFHHPSTKDSSTASYVPTEVMP